MPREVELTEATFANVTQRGRWFLRMCVRARPLGPRAAHACLADRCDDARRPVGTAPPEHSTLSACEPCTALEPTWQALAANRTLRAAGIHFGVIDAATSAGLAARFQVRGYPSLRLYVRPR